MMKLGKKQILTVVKKVDFGVYLGSDEIDGKIESVGDTQYRIHGDGLGLMYQWDSCFGISVIYPENVTEEDAIEFLKQFF